MKNEKKINKMKANKDCEVKKDWKKQAQWVVQNCDDKKLIKDFKQGNISQEDVYGLCLHCQKNQLFEAVDCALENLIELVEKSGNEEIFEALKDLHTQYSRLSKIDVEIDNQTWRKE